MEQDKNKLRIGPDTTTYAWKQKQFSQDNVNQKVCIFQGGSPPQWLCSQDLPFDNEFIFTINAIKVNKLKGKRTDASEISIGVMESEMKGKEAKDTWNHSIYLNIPTQYIERPNEKQTKSQSIKCHCQTLLQSIPCLIECHVKRNQNTITWRYNGKDQAKSSMPKSWKDGKLCAILMFWKKEDCVEFM